MNRYKRTLGNSLSEDQDFSKEIPLFVFKKIERDISTIIRSFLTNIKRDRFPHKKLLKNKKRNNIMPIHL